MNQENPFFKLDDKGTLGQSEKVNNEPISLAEKRAEKRIDNFIKQLYQAFNKPNKPKHYDDASEDPDVQKIKKKFVTDVIDKSTPKELQNQVIPLLIKAIEKWDNLRREYLSLRLKSLAAMQNKDAIKIVMDYYNQGKSLDKTIDREKRSRMMAIGWASLEDLALGYWPQDLKEAEADMFQRPSKAKDQKIGRLKELIELALDTFYAVQKQEEREAAADREKIPAVNDKEKPAEQKAKIIPFKAREKIA